MMSQTELLAWSEPDTKFFADNLLGVEDWGDSIADIKFNPDDLFLNNEDQDVELLEERDDQLSEFLSSLGDPSSPIDDFNFSSGVYIKEEPLSPSSSNSSFNSLPSSPESQFLLNGQSSPIHQPVDLELPSPNLLSNASCIKTEATLTPSCSVKKETHNIPSCGVKPIQPMPVSTVPINLQKGQVTKAVSGMISTVTNSNAIPVYIPCTGSLPTNGVVSVVVGNKVNPGIIKDGSSGGHSVVAPAMDTDVKLMKRQQRMIKNRESACLSRKKKKEYLQSLEGKVKEISNLNDSLRKHNESLKRRVNELEVENTLLRSRHPDLTSTIKKSTCVLAVVLFVALNVGPFSNLKEQWKFNRAELLPNSAIHRGRALLNYQGSEDDSMDKPLVFGPASKPGVSQTLPKVDPSMFNLSQKKMSAGKPFFRTTDRRDLMVIKNKWDFLNESRQKRRNIKKKERNPKSRRKVQSKPQNVTIDDQYICPSSFNKTEVHRLNEALDGWVKRHEDERILNQRRERVKQSRAKSAIKELALRLSSNCTEDVKRKINRHMFTRKHNSASNNAVQLFQRTDKFKSFKEEIDKKSDTLYVVSFHGDHLVLPATEYNETQRPKMSFMIMAPPNRTGWQQGGTDNTDLITMMQIDCQVMDTKLVNVKRSSIPAPHPDSPSPVSFSKDYNTPPGNTFVKPAK